MTAQDATAFAAFRDAVFDDVHLLMRLHVPRDRDAFVAHVVSLGAERGFVFDEAAVHAAMRDGEQAWLMQGVEVAS